MTERPFPSLPTTYPDGATELHLAMTESVMAQVQTILLPESEPRPRERGLIGVLHASSGRRRRTMLLRSVVVPRPGDVTYDVEHGLLFSTRYKSRAADAAAADGAGLLFLHTHPIWPGRELSFPRASPEDLESDPRDLFALGLSLELGSPLAAGIVSDAGAWAVREYTFRFPTSVEEAQDLRFGAAAARITYASAVRVVGPGLRKWPTSVGATGPAGAAGAIEPGEQDSTLRLWGEAGQAVLASLRVGHTGAGGVGGILAEHTARLGVGESLFMDYDRLSSENFNRSQGASRDDVRRGEVKVTVAVRLARASATAPDFDVLAIVGSVVEAQSIPDLLDCDIILNAADSPWARQVLDQLAFAHLIPVIHGGTSLIGNPRTGLLMAGKSEVSATGPGHPCSECAGVYTRREVTEAQEEPDARGHRGYVDLADPWRDGPEAAQEEDELRAPSVIGFNALVAGLMQLRLMAIALGTTPQALVGVQRYHVLEGIMDWSLTKKCVPDCQRPTTTAMGDAYQLPTGVDLDLARVAPGLHRA